MTRPWPRALASWLTGMLLAFLAGVSAPSAAQAGCDYPVPVWHGDPTSASTAHPMLPPASQAAHHSPFQPKAPCHGPLCSQRPAPAPVTTPDPPTVTMDTWALLDPHSPLPVPPPGSALDPRDTLALARLGRDIFHPPRLSHTS